MATPEIRIHDVRCSGLATAEPLPTLVVVLDDLGDQGAFKGLIEGSPWLP